MNLLNENYKFEMLNYIFHTLFEIFYYVLHLHFIIDWGKNKESKT